MISKNPSLHERKMTGLWIGKMAYDFCHNWEPISYVFLTDGDLTMVALSMPIRDFAPFNKTPQENKYWVVR